MMKTIAFMTLGAALALGACNKPTPGTGAKDGNGAAAASAGSTSGEVTLNPGAWEAVSDIQMAGMTNLPPQVQERMKKGQRSTHRSCLTPEKAAHPGADFFNDKSNKNCTNNLKMAGGRIDGSMTCKDPRGMASTISMNGTYGGDNYDVSMKMTAERAGEGMTWSSHTVGHRVGPCTGKE